MKINLNNLAVNEMLPGEGWFSTPEERVEWIKLQRAFIESKSSETVESVKQTGENQTAWIHSDEAKCVAICGVIVAGCALVGAAIKIASR
ncbi:MAG: hypothetical protein MJ016_01145 [Victivallaceae bacterium]|nr:hypothetical protein [Victivallaceae bacterium]